MVNETIFIENDKVGKVGITLDVENCPRTCKAIIDALPLDLDLSRWGDELYGTIPVDAPPENPTRDCKAGDIVYWLEGSGFCILFGPTPASRDEHPRLVSPGNVFGRIEGDPSLFKQFPSFKGKLVEK